MAATKRFPSLKRFPRLERPKISGELEDQVEEVGKAVITKQNICKIAERIVANELEARGFRVSDLNRDGNAPNVDLLAISHGNPLQVQVKGTPNHHPNNWRLGLGYCKQQNIDDPNAPMFNRHKDAFYKADFVVFVIVRSLREYRCFVLPIEMAEKAAQLHLDARWRTRKWKPHGLRLELVPPNNTKKDRFDEERKLVTRYEGDEGWKNLIKHARAAAK